MLAKKIAILATAAAFTAPAFADNGRHLGHYKQGHYKHSRPAVQHHYVVKHRPVVHHYHYRPAPRPVVVYHRPAPVYYQPAPVYYHAEPVNGAALLVGAVLGAAIVHAAVSH